MKTKDIFFGLFALSLVGALAYLWLSPQGLKQAPSLSVRTLKLGACLSPCGDSHR